MRRDPYARHQPGALLLLSLALTLFAMPQQAMAAPGGEAKINLTLRDTPLRSALELLFQQSGLQHAVEGTVLNVPITVNLREAPFATALRVLTRMAGVTYRKEGDVYVIGRRPPPVETTGAVEVAPPDTAAQPSGPTVEKIPVQYNSALLLGYAFGGIPLPTEEQLGFGGGFGSGFGSVGSSGYGSGGLGSFGSGGPGGPGLGSGLGSGIGGGPGGFGINGGGFGSGLGGINGGGFGAGSGFGASTGGPVFRPGSGRF